VKGGGFLMLKLDREQDFSEGIDAILHRRFDVCSTLVTIRSHTRSGKLQRTTNLCKTNL
jgi:hypothetical protein